MTKGNLFYYQTTCAIAGFYFQKDPLTTKPQLIPEWLGSFGATGIDGMVRYSFFGVIGGYHGKNDECGFIIDSHGKSIIKNVQTPLGENPTPEPITWGKLIFKKVYLNLKEGGEKFSEINYDLELLRSDNSREIWIGTWKGADQGEGLVSCQITPLGLEGVRDC